jgi:hypothetical protein
MQLTRLEQIVVLCPEQEAIDAGIRYWPFLLAASFIGRMST